MQGMSGKTSETSFKPMAEQNPGLTPGSSTVYQRFMSGTNSALSSWLPTSGTELFCLCKHFYARHVREKPGHTTCASGQSARRAGGVGSGRTGWQQNYLPSKRTFSHPPKHQRHVSSFPQKHEQAHVNRWRPKPANEPRFNSRTRSALVSWLLTS